jgi:hypothetical protein
MNVNELSICVVDVTGVNYAIIFVAYTRTDAKPRSLSTDDGRMLLKFGTYLVQYSTVL